MSSLTGSIPFNEAVHPSQAAHDVLPPESGITLSQQLGASLEYVEKHITHLPEPYSCCMLFFSVAAPGQEASVFFVRRPTLEAAWREGTTRVRQWAWVRKLKNVELRVDWPHDIASLEGRSFRKSTVGPHQDSAWALADDDLETAELIPPIRLRGGSGRPLGHPNMSFTQNGSAVVFTPMVESSLLMQMRGVHISGNGVQAGLPRVQAHLLGKARSAASWLPYVAALKMLCSHQQREGSWEEAADVRDHLGMTYALLLAEQHVSESEPAHGMSMEAIDRAISYLQENADDLLPGTGDTHVEQAMCMLVLARYLVNRDSHTVPAGVFALMERLAKTLGSAEDALTQRAREWIELAHDAFEHLQEHAGRRPASAYPARAIPARAYRLKSLLELFVKYLPESAGGAEDWLESKIGNARWYAVAVAESAYVNPCPDALRDQYRRRWGTGLQAFLSASRKRTVWPEVALFLPAPLREKAAFVSIVQGEETLMVNACTAARLLVNTFAVNSLLNL